MRVYHGTNLKVLRHFIVEGKSFSLTSHWFSYNIGYASRFAYIRAAQYDSYPTLLALNLDRLPRNCFVEFVEDGNSSLRITGELPSSELETIVVRTIKQASAIIPKLSRDRHYLFVPQDALSDSSFPKEI